MRKWTLRVLDEPTPRALAARWAAFDHHNGPGKRLELARLEWCDASIPKFGIHVVHLELADHLDEFAGTLRVVAIKQLNDDPSLNGPPQCFTKGEVDLGTVTHSVSASRFTVLPRYQRKGVGKLLAAAFMAVAVLLDGKEAQALIGVDNEASQRLFSRVGMKKRGQQTRSFDIPWQGGVPVVSVAAALAGEKTLCETRPLFQEGMNQLYDFFGASLLLPTGLARVMHGLGWPEPPRLPVADTEKDPALSA